LPKCMKGKTPIKRTDVLWEIIFLVERIKIPAHLVQTSVKEGAK